MAEIFFSVSCDVMLPTHMFVSVCIRAELCRGDTQNREELSMWDCADSGTTSSYVNKIHDVRILSLLNEEEDIDLVYERGNLNYFCCDRYIDSMFFTFVPNMHSKKLLLCNFFNHNLQEERNNI